MFNSATVFYAAVMGIMAALLISLITQYCTSSDRAPARAIARSSQAGPAINTLMGLAMGMISAALPIAVICGPSSWRTASLACGDH